jgi:uncharacterized damage-inducible protein DinB
MLSVKTILLEQFTACYDENGWFVALKNAVGNLTAEEAIWRAENLDNSIWEIVHHLNFYNEAYLKRFKGIDYVYPTNNNDETFTAGAGTISQEAWQAELARFDAIMNEWRSLLEAADESKFDEAVSATNSSAWSSVLAHLNAHNAHHGGQIVVLRKLQGIWDAKRGVS